MTRRPYSLTELRFLYNQLRARHKLGDTLVKHDPCGHAYYAKRGGRKEEAAAIAARYGDVLSSKTCSVCFKLRAVADDDDDTSRSWKSVERLLPQCHSSDDDDDVDDDDENDDYYDGDDDDSVNVDSENGVDSAANQKPDNNCSNDDNETDDNLNGEKCVDVETTAASKHADAAAYYDSKIYKDVTAAASDLSYERLQRLNEFYAWLYKHEY